MRKLMESKKGFTLVELLAVIVILAIIAAIAVPSVAHVINNTKKDAKVAEALQIVDAAKLYVASNNIDSSDGKKLTLQNAQLDPYVDKVTDTTYRVTVDFEANGVTYSISGHDANKVLGDTTDSEKQLIDYKNGN